MNRRFARSEEIKHYIISKARENPIELTSLVCRNFSLSRGTVLRHLRRMGHANMLKITGSSQKRRYVLRPVLQTCFDLSLDTPLEEDRIWREKLLPHLISLPCNVLEICQYGLEEVVNNTIEHSQARHLRIGLVYFPDQLQILVMDDGIGILSRLSSLPDLEDEKHAALELVKGKLTSDPAHHLGVGLFFTARLFDRFVITSGNLRFEFLNGQVGELSQVSRALHGTGIILQINTQAQRTLNEIFHDFDSQTGKPELDRTVVPVSLVQYGKESLLSRSQARRLLARAQQFKEIILDFSGIETVGQAFIDEIIRIFPQDHPGIRVKAINTSEEVQHLFNIIQTIAPE